MSKTSRTHARRPAPARILTGILVAALALVCAPRPSGARATSAGLDPTFGDGGKVTTDFPKDRDWPADAALQPDGKLVVVGYTEGPTSADFAVARYNADGSPDLTFGAGGKVTTSFPGYPATSGDYAQATAVAFQPDGKIVVAGAGNQFLLARYNADGTLDPSFGTGGEIFSESTPVIRKPTDVAVTPDGKVVVAGSSYILDEEGYEEVGLTMSRYNADGTPDESFGPGGARDSARFGRQDLGARAVIQSDGRVYFIDNFVKDDGFDFMLAHFNADGTPDTSFGEGGKATADFGSYEQANAVASQPDGRVVLVGSHDTTAGTDIGANENTFVFALARFGGATPTDTTPPTISCAAGAVAQADAGGCSAVVTLEAPSATDDGGALTTAGARSDGLALGDPYPLGVTEVTWTATDAAGNTASCTQSVTVLDKTPPTISGASASPAALRPPNHRMFEVTVDYFVADNCPAQSPGVTTALGVSSNEPTDGRGDGRTATDWQVLDAHRVLLRAERAGAGKGRVYTITITATDAAGNASTDSVNVNVPHDGR
jgi:uncharacterized delta-60 repeat protein